MQEEDKYEKQADDFLRCTQTEFKAMFVKNGLYFPDDKEPRDIYEITLKRGKRIYKFKFGQSIAHSSFKLINTNTGQEVKYAWFKECFEHIAQFDRSPAPGEPKGCLPRQQIEFRKFVVNRIRTMGCFKIINPEKPTAYCVLAGLTNYDVGTFEDFCANYGYDDDSRKAEKIYHAVVEEYKQIKMLYSDKDIEMLQEIN